MLSSVRDLMSRLEIPTRQLQWGHLCACESRGKDRDSREVRTPINLRPSLRMARTVRKYNSILNSPIVRALINPVKADVPSSTTSPDAGSTSTAGGPARAPAAFNPYLSIIAQERGEEQAEPSPEHLIPTQPTAVATSSDVKGKKRARSDEDLDGQVKWDQVAGTRFGVVTRYDADNLPRELEKCKLPPRFPMPHSFAHFGVCDRSRRLGSAVQAVLAVRRRMRNGSRRMVFRHAGKHCHADRREMYVVHLLSSAETRR